MNKITVSAPLAAICLMIAGCSTCGEPTEKIDENIDLPTKGEELRTSSQVPGSAKLPWEDLTLGVSTSEFKSALAALAGIEADDPAIQCRDQITIDVVDPVTGAIAERKAKNGTMSNCTLLQAGKHRSWKLVFVRGEFLGDSLVGVTFGFGVDYEAEIASQLTGRFGEGRHQKLTELSLFENKTVETVLWKVKDTIWMLSPGERSIRLIHQDQGVLYASTVSPVVAQKGTAVSLDAIGLGGGLVLSDPGIDAGLLLGGDM